MKTNECESTANRIRYKGAKAVSDMLKVNTTLTMLDLVGEQRKQKKNEQKKWHHKWLFETGNKFGEKGEKVLKEGWGSHEGDLEL